MDGTRIDKWMWAARLYKHRAQATTACGAGHVKVDGTPVKASRAVRVGDRIEAVTPGGRRIVEVLVVTETRGPAAVAATLFTDHTPPEPDDPWARVHRDRGAGRPSKRDRRKLQDWMSKQDRR